MNVPSSTCALCDMSAPSGTLTRSSPSSGSNWLLTQPDAMFTAPRLTGCHCPLWLTSAVTSTSYQLSPRRTVHHVCPSSRPIYAPETHWQSMPISSSAHFMALLNPSHFALCPENTPYGENACVPPRS